MIITTEARENLEIMYVAIIDACTFNDIPVPSFAEIASILCRVETMITILNESGLSEQFALKPFSKTKLNI